MASADGDEKDAHFECVVKSRKARRPKADPSFSVEPRKGAHREPRASAESGAKKNVLRKPPTTTNGFGRSSWTRPKEGLTKKAEVSGSSEETTESISRVPPQQSVEAPESQDPVDPVEPTSSPCVEATPGSLNDAIGFSLKQPMSSLLAEYGEQDVEWEKMKVGSDQSPKYDVDEECEPPCDSLVPDSTSERYESRLGRHGKAPIHMEFVSFGYHHGAPKEVRAGWSHGNPLPLWDTRDSISSVPPYLAWQDGLSGNVKFALLRADGARVRNLANDLAESSARAIVSAIEEGGHGFVSPLHAQVYVASDSGRHRSVVVTEMAAAALRNLLRKNDGNRFGCPCSVGTKHLHLERRQRTGPRDGNAGSKSKQKELEDD